MDLYLLQDGTHIPAGDASRDDKGVLRSKNGLAVCLYEDGTPQTVAKDAVLNKNVAAAEAVNHPPGTPPQPSPAPTPRPANPATPASPAPATPKVA